MEFLVIVHGAVYKPQGAQGVFTGNEPIFELGCKVEILKREGGERRCTVPEVRPIKWGVYPYEEIITADGQRGGGCGCFEDVDDGIGPETDGPDVEEGFLDIVVMDDGKGEGGDAGEERGKAWRGIGTVVVGNEVVQRQGGELGEGSCVVEGEGREDGLLEEQVGGKLFWEFPRVAEVGMELQGEAGEFWEFVQLR